VLSVDNHIKSHLIANPPLSHNEARIHKVAIFLGTARAIFITFYRFQDKDFFVGERTTHFLSLKD
jgi:hypothetical protein